MYQTIVNVLHQCIPLLLTTNCKVDTLMSPFYRYENWNKDDMIKLPKVAQVERSRVRVWTQAGLHQNTHSSPPLKISNTWPMWWKCVSHWGWTWAPPCDIIPNSFFLSGAHLCYLVPGNSPYFSQTLPFSLHNSGHTHGELFTTELSTRKFCWQWLSTILTQHPISC